MAGHLRTDYRQARDIYYVRHLIGFAAAAAAAPDLPFYAGLVCAGVGQGLLLPSIMRIVLLEVAPEKAGLASGVISSTLQIGSAFGTAAISGAFFGALGAVGAEAAPVR